MHHGVNYVWYVFTNEHDSIHSRNVIFITERLDVYKWIQDCDYLVQLSDTEACSYSINEALAYGKQVVVTPLPYLEELGIRNGENAVVLNFDCSNIQEVVEMIKKPKSITWNAPADNYKKYLKTSKSNYEEKKKTMKRIRIKANIRKFSDLKYNGLMRKALDEWLEEDSRADDLINRGFAELVPEPKVQKVEIPEEPIKEEKKEKAVAKKEKATVKKPTEVKKNAKK